MYIQVNYTLGLFYLLSYSTQETLSDLLRQQKKITFGYSKKRKEKKEDANFDYTTSVAHTIKIQCIVVKMTHFMEDL